MQNQHKMSKYIADARFGSKAEVGQLERHVRFAPESRHQTDGVGMSAKGQKRTSNSGADQLRPSAAILQAPVGRLRAEADISPPTIPVETVENDPEQTFSRSHCVLAGFRARWPCLFHFSPR